MKTLKILLALSIFSSPLYAQLDRPILEGRIDLIAGKETMVQGGGGIAWKLNNYVQIGGAAGIGPGSEGLSARIDGFGRFMFDPTGTAVWGPYAGGGISFLNKGESDTDPFLLAFVGVEHRGSGRWNPALELGLGGGVRFGIVLRAAGPRK